jgi:hypothetical protein
MAGAPDSVVVSGVTFVHQPPASFNYQPLASSLLE